MSLLSGYKKLHCIIVLACMVCGCHNNANTGKKESEAVRIMINTWHAAAAKADYKSYFDLMTDDAVFIGTDATENWNKNDFMVWAKPFFDRGKAWAFTSVQRHVYFNEAGNLAWFDELLNTQMKICRGSGVVVKTSSGWKIQHYVLSVTVPNDKIDSVILIKAPIEDSLIKKLVKE
jgi:ketosteroid isomerase-like protein